MRCSICNSDSEVGKCIVCGKWVCYEKHAELFWFKVSVGSDCRVFLESKDYSFELYCCLEGHDIEEIKKALQREFRKIPKFIDFIKK